MNSSAQVEGITLVKITEINQWNKRRERESAQMQVDFRCDGITWRFSSSCIHFISEQGRNGSWQLKRGDDMNQSQGIVDCETKYDHWVAGRTCLRLGIKRRPGSVPFLTCLSLEPWPLHMCDLKDFTQNTLSLQLEHCMRLR